MSHTFLKVLNIYLYKLQKYIFYILELQEMLAAHVVVVFVFSRFQPVKLCEHLGLKITFDHLRCFGSSFFAAVQRTKLHTPATKWKLVLLLHQSSCGLVAGSYNFCCSM